MECENQSPGLNPFQMNWKWDWKWDWKWAVYVIKSLSFHSCRKTVVAQNSG